MTVPGISITVKSGSVPSILYFQLELKNEGVTLALYTGTLQP